MNFSFLYANYYVLLSVWKMFGYYYQHFVRSSSTCTSFTIFFCSRIYL